MGEGSAELSGPDLEQGVPLAEIGEGEMLLGHARGEPVLLARSGGELFAVGGSCTHFGVSLAEGILTGGTVRCAAHHAAFDLRTGEAVRAPAFNPLACWAVEERDGKAYVTGKRSPACVRVAAPATAAAAGRAAVPDSVVIVGAGAAGSAAAETLRREGYAGRITLLGAERDAPYDRPNASKDYLAGTAPEAWMPLWPETFYAEQGIDLVLSARVARIDTAGRAVRTVSGQSYPYGALLLATGADPVRLPLATSALPHVHYLRSLADSRAIAAATAGARRAVVVGASFIGLEAAAALRARGVEVHVVSPQPQPLHHVLGAELGDHVRALHRENGVVFHLPDTVAAIDARQVTLKSGRTLPAELVVVGIGVRPGVGLASWAGLALHKGAVAVNAYMQTSVPGIFAAGDLVCWPDPRTGELIRSEHWVVAQRQGQTAARNLLGRAERFEAASFFWSRHYDLAIQYVGHAERWDRVELDGSLADGDCTATYWHNGRPAAVATIGRDRLSLRVEEAMERLDWPGLGELLRAGVEVGHA
jgi:apoptosis-inducing factor 3